MARKQEQIGNGKNRRKPNIMHGNDILHIELTRDEFQLVSNIMNHPELMLKKPEWGHGEKICEKLSKVLSAQ